MKSVLFGLLFISNFAFADLLTLTPSQVNEKGVNVAASASLEVAGVAYPLTSVGYGLRWKKVFGVPVDVYVGQVFATDASVVVRDEVQLLKTVTDQKAVAINLNFLRDVKVSDIVSSFEAGLEANEVGDDADVDAFLDIAEKAGNATAGKSLIVTFVKNDDGTETLTYANTGSGFQESYVGKAGFAQQVYSAWLGNPSDEGIGAFKAAVMKERN